MNYYTYKINFVDGFYYYGRRSCKCRPEDDTYYGSPKTHKDKWRTTMFSKEIISTHNTLEESDIAEGELIGDSYKTDPLCLNEHNRGNFYNTGHSLEARAKMSATHKARGTGKGRKLTEETRRKMSEAKKGKVFTEEHKAALSTAWRRKYQAHLYTPEVREKIAAKNRGKKRTPEQRARMSEAAKKRWAKHKEV